MTSIIQKVRTSFTTQLTLWVATLVTVISVVVIGLLAMFSQDVIFDETVDMTLQAMETTALRIDNTLRQKEMSARLEGGQVRVNRAAIDRLIEENGCLAKLHQTLPNAELYVTPNYTTSDHSYGNFEKDYEINNGESYFSIQEFEIFRILFD